MTLKNFQGDYENKNWIVLREQDKDKEVVQKFAKEIVELDKEVREKLKNLTAISQELIQLIKQLILTLRLPANVGLFGMNIDILQSNPSWWLYLTLAAGTTTLTFAVWIIFKGSENLEGRIEGNFRWLTKQKIRDEETGLGTGTKRKVKSS
ncbi:MAG: Ankyrin-2 [Cirrosporium novae-zelandiae]|nr:MAG: Ankyrin-2 [Cirrosporium novae-zelandiae]